MRVLFTGSRAWSGFHPEEKATQIFLMTMNLGLALDNEFTVVHGDCPTGFDAHIDRIARRWEAYDSRIKVEPHSADWKRYGKPAGPRRNQEMVDRGADMCIGAVREDSIGTSHCMALARNARIPTFSINWDPQWPEPPQEFSTVDIDNEYFRRHLDQLSWEMSDKVLATDPEFQQSLRELKRGDYIVLREGDLRND